MMSDVKLPKNNKYMDSKKQNKDSIENAFNDFKESLEKIKV